MFRNIPTITKNLLIINVLAFMAGIVLGGMGISLDRIFGLHFFLASDFHLYQFVTYQFLHGGIAHLFFNMFALWMFGCVIEEVWGAKKFLFYYITCGIFAGFCQEIVQFANFYLSIMSQVPSATMGDVFHIAASYNLNGWLTIGASGAVYAILLAFGMTFPNERIFIFPLPVPIKAKWFVMIYAMIELVSAWSATSDGVAHMAHLGGMLSGFLLILYWRKHPDNHFDRDRGWEFLSRWNNRNKRGGSTWESTSMRSSAHFTATRQDDMEYNANEKRRQEEIDKILDKIRTSGYDSLSKDEKQRLFEASRNK